MDDPRVAGRALKAESDNVSFVTFSYPLRHPIDLFDWFAAVSCFLGEFTGEAFEFVGAVFPEGLALREVCEESDLVASVFFCHSSA